MRWSRAREEHRGGHDPADAQPSNKYPPSISSGGNGKPFFVVCRVKAVGLGGRRVLLAHVRFRSLLSVGRYGVEPDRLVPLIEEELTRTPGTVDAYLIDEIGKLECHCPQFIEAVDRLLEGPVPLVATIALRGEGSSPRSRIAMTRR